MINVDGAWNIVVNTPMGPKTSVLTVNSNGSAFEGFFEGDMGKLEVKNGKVDGNSLSWTMNMTVPIPMPLDCVVNIEGNAIKGTATAGTFGKFPLKGERA